METFNLQQQEDALLASLQEEQLIVATAAVLKPGVALYYKLGDTYGCHIIRGPKQIQEGYVYNDVAGLRAGVAAGNFYIIPQDNGEGSSMV